MPTFRHRRWHDDDDDDDDDDADADADADDADADDDAAAAAAAAAADDDDGRMHDDSNAMLGSFTSVLGSKESKSLSVQLVVAVAAEELRE